MEEKNEANSLRGTNEVVAGEGDPNIDGDIADDFFEAATLARTPREDLHVLATGDPTNGDLVTLWPCVIDGESRL